MGSFPDIVEISSEEDDEIDFSGGSSMEGSLEWISGLLDDQEIANFHDLVVVDQCSAPPVVQKKTNNNSINDLNIDEDGDDDCLVLDSDPTNPVSIVGNKGDTNGGDGSEELQIVAEKGQLACRDFPHPRHLCANFPFSSTLHVKHCEKCHCYVCDTVAPCKYWGSGASPNDHCHATYKEPKWKTLKDLIPSMKPHIYQNAPPLLPRSHQSFHPNPHLPSQSYTFRPCAPTVNIQQHHPIRSCQVSPRSQISPRANATSLLSHSHARFKVSSRPMLHRSHSIPSPVIRRTQFVPHSNQPMGSSAQAVATHRAAPAVPQRSPSVQLESLADVDTKSWQDILASVASELGVSDYGNSTNTDSSVGPQQIRVSSQPVPSAIPSLPVCDNFAPETNNQRSGNPGSSMNDLANSLYDFDGTWGGANQK